MYGSRWRATLMKGRELPNLYPPFRASWHARMHARYVLDEQSTLRLHKVAGCQCRWRQAQGCSCRQALQHPPPPAAASSLAAAVGGSLRARSPACCRSKGPPPRPPALPGWLKWGGPICLCGRWSRHLRGAARNRPLQGSEAEYAGGCVWPGTEMVSCGQMTGGQHVGRGGGGGSGRLAGCRGLRPCGRAAVRPCGRVPCILRCIGANHCSSNLKLVKASASTTDDARCSVRAAYCCLCCCRHACRPGDLLDLLRHPPHAQTTQQAPHFPGLSRVRGGGAVAAPPPAHCDAARFC